MASQRMNLSSLVLTQCKDEVEALFRPAIMQPENMVCALQCLFPKHGEGALAIHLDLHDSFVEHDPCTPWLHGA